MSTNLQYNFVASHDEDDVLTAGFADAQFETNEYLWFQRYFDPDEDEGIYIERDGQHQGTYGGIESLVLLRNKAVITVSDETAQILQTEQEIIISFSANDSQFEEFQSGLKRIFEGEHSFRII